MKHYFVFIIIGLTLEANCQNYDYNWVMGFPNTIYNFDSASIYKVDTFALNKSIFFTLSGGCMSDKNGHLLFISNGLQINDRNDNLMEGGNQLALGAFDTTSGGYDFRQSPMSLPMPGNDSLYYFFYEAYWDSTIPEASRLYYGIIDMYANNSLGKVMSLNNILIDTFISDGGLSACKHANGKDWWLVKPKYQSNEYFKFLIKANGVIEGPFIQSIGLASQVPDWNCELVFSPAGDKMFYGNGLNNPTLFDFDRCTGMLSNPRIFQSIIGTHGASFSPDGRFLYVTNDSLFVNLYQLDTYSQSIDITKILLASFDPAQFNTINYHQLAPNNKIYISGYGSPTPLSVINRPDSFGFACSLDTFGYDSLPGYTLGMPNFPYYRTPPARAYQADAGHDTTICFGDTVMLGVPSVDSVVYQWQNNTGFLSSTDIAQPIAVPQQTTSYYLTINDTVPHGYSCNVRTDTITVHVVPLPCVLGITDINSDVIANIKLYPNPAKDYTALFYNIPTSQQATFAIYNQLGQLVKQQKLLGTANSYVIETRQLQDGVYNYRFVLNNQVIKRDKFVVVR